jgi:MFS family permease
MMNNQINANKLFLASRIALIATAMTFAIRSNLIEPLGTKFSITLFEMGIVTSTAFWGFTLSTIIGGWLCDLLGMKKLFYIAFIGHILGIFLTIIATGFWSLFISTLLIGIANGMVEAFCNPLVATLYPDQKTKKLNQFHVWFPGGIVIGGLIGFGLDQIHLAWEWQLAAILIPTILYGILFSNQTFPVTERVSSGVSKIEMLKECKRPLFLFMVFCMFLTAATELDTNQWITVLLGNVGVSSILLLVYIYGLMAIGRSFAGEIEKRLSPAGMLLFSAFFSSIGLFMLSQTTGYWSFAAAAVFAVGICFFWPTMLGFVSEYIPKTGALGLSIIGGAGMLFASFMMPLFANLYVNQTESFLPKGSTIEMLKNSKVGSEGLNILNQAQNLGGASTLAYVSLLPAFLVIAFGALYLLQRKKLSEL